MADQPGDPARRQPQVQRLQQGAVGHGEGGLRQLEHRRPGVGLDRGGGGGVVHAGLAFSSGQVEHRSRPGIR
jgi:hypothetical protein